MTLDPAITQPNTTVALTQSDIIKNIHYQLLRCFRLKSIGGQSLKLPREPKYTIPKNMFRLPFSMSSSWWFKGLNYYYTVLG